jgi:hypothetical protein
MPIAVGEMKMWRGRTMELHFVASAWYQKSLAYLYYLLGMKLIKLESTVKYKYKNTDLLTVARV